MSFQFGDFTIPLQVALRHGMLKQEEPNTTEGKNLIYQQNCTSSPECRVCRGEGRPFIGHSQATCSFVTKNEKLRYSDQEDHYSDEYTDSSDSEFYSDYNEYDSDDSDESEIFDREQHISVRYCQTSAIAYDQQNDAAPFQKKPKAPDGTSIQRYQHTVNSTYQEVCRVCYGEGRQFTGHSLTSCPFVTKEDIVGYSDEKDQYRDDDISDSSGSRFHDGYDRASSPKTRSDYKMQYLCTRKHINSRALCNIDSLQVVSTPQSTVSKQFGTIDSHDEIPKRNFGNMNVDLGNIEDWSPCKFCGENEEACECDIVTDFCILHQQSFTTNAPVLEMDPDVCYCGIDGLTNGKCNTGDTDPSSTELHTELHVSPARDMSDSVIDTSSSLDHTQHTGDTPKNFEVFSAGQDVASNVSIKISTQMVEMNTFDEQLLSTDETNICKEDDAKDRSTHCNASISRNHPRNDTFSDDLQHGPPGFDVSSTEQAINITHCLKYMESLTWSHVRATCGKYDVNAVPVLHTVVCDTVVKDVVIGCKSAKEVLVYGGHNNNFDITNAKPKDRISSLFLSEERERRNVTEPSANICIPDNGVSNEDVTSYMSAILIGHTGDIQHCEEVASPNICTSTCKNVTVPTCGPGDTTNHHAVSNLSHSYGMSASMEYKDKEATDPCIIQSVRDSVYSVKDTTLARIVRTPLAQANACWSSFLMSSIVNQSLIPVLNGLLFYSHAPRPPEFHAHYFIAVVN